MNDTDYAQWQIERAIKAAQYALDQKDLVTFANYFTEDGKLFRPTSKDPVCGRDAIIAVYQNNPSERLNRHLLSNVHVTHMAEGVAHSVSYVTLYSATQTAHEKPVTGWPLQRALVGEYHDTWRRTSDQWLLSERRALFSINLLIGEAQ
ncbi:nuclear transport factor 2 family protein [Aestuariicella hydrocarbonica]|uniref:Nuclear transport factor 2 family protein n=1 Tax=Pseudomaricurvus hydrocarbonicus TaxID=1470433 RepID=A0A9E5MN87_9GAMM|nr:nuclear transport factor 2 family protein [Aestuariicella hydrocarbonica]NHO67356.1 nuclear transport factor 2 family protein [Aestuariicella hydrocarbonica]